MIAARNITPVIIVVSIIDGGRCMTIRWELENNETVIERSAALKHVKEITTLMDSVQHIMPALRDMEMYFLIDQFNVVIQKVRYRKHQEVMYGGPMEKEIENLNIDTS